MLPPPMTRPTDAPVLMTATTSSAKPADGVEVVAESLLSGEGFAGEFEQDARILQVGHVRVPLFAELVANEPPHLDVLARLRRRLPSRDRRSSCSCSRTHSWCMSATSL